jgi:hypothetical protein
VIVDQEFFVDSVPILDDEHPGIFTIVKDFKSAIDGCDLVTQKVPAEMSLTGRLPTSTSSSI